MSAAQLWGLFYLAVFLGILGYVQYVGERESRFAMWTLVIASLLTLAAVLAGFDFRFANIILTSLDFAVLAVFLGHALVSKRYWTLCLPAFQSITCMFHVTKFVDPDILPRVYSAGQGFWAYPQMAIILLAAIWANAEARDRKRREAEARKPPR